MSSNRNTGSRCRHQSSVNRSEAAFGEDYNGALAVFSASVSGLVRQPPVDFSQPSRLLLAVHPLECPDCGRLYLILRELQNDIGSRLRIVFRHYPLSGIHHHAQQAAQAAEAAGAQGQFWEMHALFFERQGELRTNDLIGYAEDPRPNVERFHNELKHQTYSDIVRADFIAEFRTAYTGFRVCF